MVSRVGKDELGQDLVEKCKELGLNPEFLQEDLIHPTGTVEVELDSQGQAEYEIKEDVAWDHLEWNDGLKNLAGNCAAVCFGTLCQRHSVTRNTLKNFLERCPKKPSRSLISTLGKTFITVKSLKNHSIKLLGPRSMNKN